VLATKLPHIGICSTVAIPDERAGLLYQRHRSLHDFAFIAVSRNSGLSLIRLVGGWSVGDSAMTCPSQSRKFGGIVHGVDFTKPFLQLSLIERLSCRSYPRPSPNNALAAICRARIPTTSFEASADPCLRSPKTSPMEAYKVSPAMTSLRGPPEPCLVAPYTLARCLRGCGLVNALVGITRSVRP
jgi:hypothetical protein